MERSGNWTEVGHRMHAQYPASVILQTWGCRIEESKDHNPRFLGIQGIRTKFAANGGS